MDQNQREDFFNYLKASDVIAEANNDKFGELKFPISGEKLNLLKEQFLKLYDLDYTKYLFPHEVSRLETHVFPTWRALFDRLKAYSINISGHIEAHNQLEDEIRQFYENTIEILRSHLIVIRSEVGANFETDKGKITKEANDLLKNVKKVAKESEDKLKTFEIASTSVKVGTNELAEAFQKQVGTDENEGKIALKNRKYFVIALAGTMISIFIGSAFLLAKNPDEWKNLFENTLIFIGLIISFITLLYLGVSFNTKRYFIARQSKATNEHRRNVANTILYIYNSDIKDETFRTEMIKQAAEAMFKQIDNDASSDDLLEKILEVASKRA